MSFILDERLQNDTIFLADFPLCRLLLMNDKQFPWFILVPRVLDVTEVHQLDAEQTSQFNLESAAVSHFLVDCYAPETLNIAALGNIVRQLHVHHIARFTDDKAWPKPIWGLYTAQPYTDIQLQTLRKKCLDYAAIDQLINVNHQLNKS
jgi:diadenosine tetraphosphate (Ap4A) HIT family hydrolase